MTTIAHLSDLHMIEDKARWQNRLRQAFLGIGRHEAAASRRARGRLALAKAVESGADHVVITGDLTEEGTRGEFEVVAEILYESGLDPERVTLVPGNHDAYQDGHAFRRALSGPLAAYAGTSSPGRVAVHEDVMIMSVSTAIPQPITTSRGALDATMLDRMSCYSSPRWLGSRILLLAQHHPPYRHPTPGMQWLDGLVQYRQQRALLEYAPRTHVLHGHLHRRRDVEVVPLRDRQVFGASAVVGAKDPLRLYQVTNGRLLPT